MRLWKFVKISSGCRSVAVAVAKAIVVIVMLLSLLVFSAETEMMWLPFAGLGMMLLCGLAANRLWDFDDDDDGDEYDEFWHEDD